MPHTLPEFETFQRLATDAAAQSSGVLVPMYRRLFSDQLTPVLAYRRLVGPDQRMAPSFLFESVVDGARVGRYSFLGSRPVAEVIARGHDVEYRDHRETSQSRRYHSDDPLQEMDRLTATWRLVDVPGLPRFTGGWLGYAGYDTVRYLEGDKLTAPPPDDRHLPDLHMQLYFDVVAFDHVQKTMLAITHVLMDEHASAEAAYAAGEAQLDALVHRLVTPREPVGSDGAELATGDHVDLDSPPSPPGPSTMGATGYRDAVRKAKEYIAAGDIFQVVPSQRFERRTPVDPFDIYRALRVVNPSPYMFYLQIDGGMLVGSSPEILCRVEDGVLTNRPLAGTRRRGRTPEEDAQLEAELQNDPKDRAEHIMLVDLGRNDVGRVAAPGSVELPAVLEVERYSHVMHLSSTVTGKLRDGQSAWDALRVTLPVGTVSGAPKVRAMQIIDELEPTRRGPYGGAVGYTDFAGNMDMAIALRTMVVLP
ncbi:MAG: chorismate-binding protein, partial [Phycisphaeraceae bacterium]